MHPLSVPAGVFALKLEHPLRDLAESGTRAFANVTVAVIRDARDYFDLCGEQLVA